MAWELTDRPGDSPLRDVPEAYALGGRAGWLVLRDGPDAGRRLYFADRRLGEGDGPVVMLVHGNPECSFMWRRVVQALERRALPAGTRIVAPDHIGFGRSDQARFEMVDMHHAENLAQLVQALDLRDVTLVVHDWGGPIGIGALLREPERVANLVVLNTTVFPLPEDHPRFDQYPVPVVMPWPAMADRVPDRLWGVFAALAAGVTPAGLAGLLRQQAAFAARAARGAPPAGVDRESFDVIRGQFSSRANVRSSKRMVRQTRVWGHGYAYDDPVRGRQDNHDFYRWVQETLPGAWAGVGAAAVFGAWDPLAKPSSLRQWTEALPQLEGRVQVHAGVSHFVEQHRPEEIAAEIERLLHGG